MNLLRALVGAAAIAFGTAPLAEPAASSLGVAIVTRDQVALRAAPRGSVQSNAILWQGEALEVRGERMDYLQVYDHRRERGGFVHASYVRRTNLAAADAPELLAVVRFLRDTSGAEALGIGFAAAFVQAASPEVLNGEMGIEALDALGTFADRLARRTSSRLPTSKDMQTRLSAHMDVAARYGVNFTSLEREGGVQICYDGDAFRRVLAMRSSPEQRARAALALTRQECMDPALRPHERNRMDEWRATVLDRVDASALPHYLSNRVLMRRASVWASLAYQRARKGDDAAGAAQRALTEIAGVKKNDLTDEGLRIYREAAIRVNASRWASHPAPTVNEGELHVVAAPGKSGDTCIALIDAKDDTRTPLAKRCTYGIVWMASATLNREGTALALAVQPTETWREMWVFRKAGGRWTIRVIPPAITTPDLGYAEFAGWVPGGARMLVAREAASEGTYHRRFQVVRLDTFASERQASDPSVLRAFQQWRDLSWHRETLSVR